MASGAPGERCAVRISKTYRPEVAVGRQRSRASLPELYLDVPARRLVAMDGEVLVALPVAVGRGERSGFVAGDALRAARRREPAEEQAQLRAAPPGRSRADRLAAFPGWRGLLPGVHRGERGVATVTVHLGQLQRLADAMGVVAVTLTVPARRGGRQGPVLVQPIDPEAREIGVLLARAPRTPQEKRAGAFKLPGSSRRGALRRQNRLRNLQAQADALLAGAGSPELVAKELA